MHDWLLDIGATDHVCHSRYYFTFLKPIKPINIRLPKWSQYYHQFFRVNTFL